MKINFISRIWEKSLCINDQNPITKYAIYKYANWEIYIVFGKLAEQSLNNRIFEHNDPDEDPSEARDLLSYWQISKNHKVIPEKNYEDFDEGNILQVQSYIEATLPQ